MLPSAFVAAYTASCAGWQYGYCCQNVISYTNTAVSKEKSTKERKREREKWVKDEEKKE
jgi:hypothetical protein